MDIGKMTKWKEGDYCLARWREGYRQFQIVTITKNNSAYLHATSKRPGERLTIRTVRRLQDIVPVSQSEKTMGYTIVQILTLLIPLAALIGLIYAIFKPSVLDKDK